MKAVGIIPQILVDQAVYTRNCNPLRLNETSSVQFTHKYLQVLTIHQMTREIIDVAKPLGIAVHDHIIVGREGHASLKGLRLI
jgi:hypothetical protein